MFVQCCCYSGYHEETEDWTANTFEGNHYDTDNGLHWKANPIPRETKASNIDYDALQPQFCWLPLVLIKKTFQATTQFAKLPASAYLWKRFKTPHPANNVWRRSEDVASDTLFSDTPAIDSGVKCAQIFFGTHTMVTDIHAMGTSKELFTTLQDTVIKGGAPNCLLADSARVECSYRVMTYLRLLFIDIWQSEAYHQHQNPAER